MIDMEISASARLPAASVWLKRVEGLARAVADAVRRVNRWLRRRLSSLGRARARRIALRELHALNDRVLKDIGVRRDQVAEIVDGMFRRGGAEAITLPIRAVATESAEAITEANDSDDRRCQSAA